MFEIQEKPEKRPQPKNIMTSCLEELWRSHYAKCVVIGYWMLGLTNNFAYVIMLSAAHDILGAPDNDHNKTLDYFSFKSTNNLKNQSNKYDCNELSTGTILLGEF
jgi:hypothetical protein